MLKGIFEGLGGSTKKPIAYADIPPEAMKAMQDSALAGISRKAGPTIPILKGPDPGLPKMAPVFDFDELRKKNEARAKRIK